MHFCPVVEGKTVVSVHDLHDLLHDLLPSTTAANDLRFSFLIVQSYEERLVKETGSQSILNGKV